ncbi:hypothetical protein Agub_g12568, partial [Astrephomene gubernaculifera]
MSLEEALSHVGTGPFQWMVLGVCGLANAADAVEILSVSLLGAAAEQEFNLTPRRTGALNACIFVGMFLGGLIWGQLGDAIGRRRALLAACALNAGFGALSAAARSLPALLVLRLGAGLGVGGSMPVVFAIMSEFCSPSSRGKFMAMLASTWMLGSLYSASAGWLLIPLAGLGWRVFVLAACLPAAAAAALTAVLLPESPRYLSVMGRGREAAAVLQLAAKMNGRRLPPHALPPSFHHHDQDILTAAAAAAVVDTAVASDAVAVAVGSTAAIAANTVGSTAGPGPHSLSEAVAVAVAATTASPPIKYPPPVLPPPHPLQQPHNHQHQPKPPAIPPSAPLWRFATSLRAAGCRSGRVLRVLLRPPLLRYTLPLAAGWVGLCGGWYCTVLWVPRYFEQRGARGQDVYAETFAVALANLPGNLASIWLVDRLGRRLTACVCMAGACVAALMFAAAPAHGGWPLAAACVFNGISVGGWNSLDMISAELYPTSLRSSGFGLLNALGRLSSFATTYAAGALMEGAASWAPLLLAAVLLAAGSAAMLSLPEPAGKPLQDSFCEEDLEREGHLQEERARLLEAGGSCSGGSSLRQALRGG